jgi:hypothetical protein
MKPHQNLETRNNCLAGVRRNNQDVKVSPQQSSYSEKLVVYLIPSIPPIRSCPVIKFFRQHSQEDNLRWRYILHCIEDSGCDSGCCPGPWPGSGKTASRQYLALDCIEGSIVWVPILKTEVLPRHLNRPVIWDEL